jgi:hypothetical protein
MAEGASGKQCMLVIVKHPDKGDQDNGKAICDKIRQKVSTGEGAICMFHDATHMSTANPAYATEFKMLDRDIASRLTEVVCAIPGSIPRMLAHTVAMFSEKDWEIFKALPDAIFYVNSKGFKLTEQDVADAEDVSVWVV